MTFRIEHGADIGQSQTYKLAGGHISKVMITLDPVYFSDDSKWLSGRYFIAVPPPIVWQEVTPAEFVAGAQAKDKP